MLLAVDTSTAQVGLAVYDGSLVVAEYAWRNMRGGRHTVDLAPAVSELLMRCALHMDAIEALGVALGPGSFTSLRVGLSLTKGLVISRRLPLIGIPTLDILAAAQPPSAHTLVVAIQAGRGKFAVGRYQWSDSRWQAEGLARVLPLAALAAELQGPVLLCGELTAQERASLAGIEGVQLASPAQSIRRPAILAELAWSRWQAGDVDDQATLAPIYLHVAGSIPA